MYIERQVEDRGLLKKYNLAAKGSISVLLNLLGELTTIPYFNNF